MSKNLTGIAKALRKRPTDAESLLWRHLRSKQVEGLKFRRQEPVGKFVVDFVCFEKKIVIEVDGGQHAQQTQKDGKRDEWLSGEGFRILRFWNNEVLSNIEGGMEVIRTECLK